jgi:sterol desaturase/sphingolipid hydroxylase (fatty acid hydroxylase superfamily)
MNRFWETRSVPVATLPNPMRTILIVLLILFLLGALPAWPYSQGWGYYPSGGLLIVIVLILLLAPRSPP